VESRFNYFLLLQVLLAVVVAVASAAGPPAPYAPQEAYPDLPPVYNVSMKSSKTFFCLKLGQNLLGLPWHLPATIMFEYISSPLLSTRQLLAAQPGHQWNVTWKVTLRKSSDFIHAPQLSYFTWFYSKFYSFVFNI